MDRATVKNTHLDMGDKWIEGVETMSKCEFLVARIHFYLNKNGV